MLEVDKATLQENYFVGLIFDEGYWFVRLARKQQRTVYKPYWFNSETAIAVNDVSDWETPTDTEGRYYFEPQDKDEIYQTFLGLTPSSAKIYLAYPKRENRMNLIAPRDVPGVIGFWDGEDTPYHDPSPATEIWTVHDKIPYFNVENNGITGQSTKIGMSIYITPFSYKVIKDPVRIERFIDGKERATIRTMGDPERPMGAPRWMLDNYKKYMLKVVED